MLRLYFSFYNLSSDIILDIFGDTSSDYFLRTYSKHSVTAVTRHNVPSYLLLPFQNISFQILHILWFFHTLIPSSCCAQIRLYFPFYLLSQKILTDTLRSLNFIRKYPSLHVPVLGHFFDFYQYHVNFISFYILGR